MVYSTYDGFLCTKSVVPAGNFPQNNKRDDCQNTSLCRGHFWGVITHFFYWYVSPHSISSFFVPDWFVSEFTVLFALPHPVYVAILFSSRLWSYIVVRHLLVFAFCFTSRDVRKVVSVCHFTVVVYLIVVKVIFLFFVSSHTSPYYVWLFFSRHVIWNVFLCTTPIIF